MRQRVIKWARFTLDRLLTYKGKGSEFLIDALFYGHVRTKTDLIQRQFTFGKKKKQRRGKKGKKPQIDFLIKGTNRYVLELAHRKKGQNVGYQPSANSGELKKLSSQTNKSGRFLLIIDPSAKPLKKEWLKSQYDRFKLRGRRRQKGRKSVRVIYVHRRKSASFDFPWDAE